MENITLKKSTCFLCMGNCGLDVYVKENRVVRISGTPENPYNKGVLCSKGGSNIELLYHPERLLYPLKRAGARGQGNWSRISWDEALDTIASRLKAVRDKYGPEAALFFVGYVKEPRRWFQRLAYLYGSPNYLTESSVCNSAREIANRTVLGYPVIGPPEYGKCGCLLVWSSNPAHSYPAEIKQILQARDRGMKIIVVDPRHTFMARHADIHLGLRPGTDGALALGVLHVLIKENLYDGEFVAGWVKGFEGLKELVKTYTPQRVEGITRIPADRVINAARLIAASGPVALRDSASSTVHSVNGVQNHRAILSILAVTGSFDTPGGNTVPAGIALKDVTLFKEMIGCLKPRIGEDRWPVWTMFYPEAQCNCMFDQIETGSPYPLKAMIGIGPNLMMWPNSKKTASALSKLDFIAVSDFFHTPTTAMADIVLPAATALERTNLIRRGNFIMLRRNAVEPCGEARPDQKIIFELAERLGLGGQFWDGSLEKALAEELEPSRLTLAMLDENPAGLEVDMGPRRYSNYLKGGFPTPTGKVEIASTILERFGYDALPVYRGPLESPLSTPELAGQFPLVLTTGGRLPMYTHSELRNLESLRQLYPGPRVDINPQDARPRKIQQGGRVMLKTARGVITAEANVTGEVPEGVVHMAHGWPQADVNLLTDSENLDPISGFPAFKGLLCQVSIP